MLLFAYYLHLLYYRKPCLGRQHGGRLFLAVTNYLPQGGSAIPYRGMTAPSSL